MRDPILESSSAAEILREAIDTLTIFRIPDKRSTAESFLRLATGADPLRQSPIPDRLLTEHEVALFRRSIRRRLQGEPTDYIVGRVDFLGIELLVNSSVVIPKAATGYVARRAIAFGQQMLAGRAAGSLRILDCGTGCGCIALALARELSTSSVIATDISMPALSTAQANVQRLGLSRVVRCVQADLLSCFSEQSIDLLVSNPPYLREDKTLNREGHHEPPVGIYGGPDGLDLYRKLIVQAARVLRPGGWAVFEPGDQQEPERLLSSSHWSDFGVERDTDGTQMAIWARRTSTIPA